MVVKIPTPYLVASAAGTLVGGCLLLKDYCGGESYKGSQTMEGKTVVITGANTGIGRETALELAKRKAKVIMACRDMKKCEESRRDIVLQSENKHVVCRECDLASMKSIHEFAEKFKKEEQRLDVLINNAGVMRCPRSVTKEGIETQLGVNHMGHFLLTHLLLDKLKQSAPSRIINVSSVAHTRGHINLKDLNSEQQYDSADAYNQSKLANVLFTKELALRLQGTGVTVNAVHPGIVDTDIVRHMSFTQSTFASVFLKPLAWPFIKTPKQGAQTTLFAALDPSFDTVTGQYLSNCRLSQASDAGQDAQMARILYQVSLKWTRLPIAEHANQERLEADHQNKT